tara:strand:- start:473 stop:901 length:429 start_codon:yes stop_codon:yes gene_type:complete
MWKYYFPFSKITGIDIDNRCKKYEQKRIAIYIGDQKNNEFLNKVEKNRGPFDIIIDDGGHYHSQSIISFELLFKQLNSGGIYAIEDLHTSYHCDENYDKFFDYNLTSIEYFKNLIDDINYGKNHFKIDYVHFHPSMIFIGKI